MGLYPLSRLLFLFTSLGSAGIYFLALVCVVAWPQVRGRGLFLIALSLKCVVASMYLLANLLQVVWGGGMHVVDVDVIGFGYMALSAVSLAADATLAAAFLNLGHVFRLMQRNSDVKTPPMEGG